jgi:hypothetical protein
MVNSNVYHFAKPTVNDDDVVHIDLVSPPPVCLVSGNRLAHNRFDLIGKAFLGADLHRGTLQLVRPTLKQAAMLARVNPTYVWWAIKRQAQRAKIEAGLLPLVPSAPKNSPAISDEDLIETFRKVGVEHAFDVLVAAAR